jgi:glucose-1-phosphate thymidylyltransferase
MAEAAGARLREIIGLIPAGGVAERLSPLPCSKEIYPIGFKDSHCHHLESFAE